MVFPLTSSFVADAYIFSMLYEHQQMYLYATVEVIITTEKKSQKLAGLQLNRGLEWQDSIRQ